MTLDWDKYECAKCYFFLFREALEITAAMKKWNKMHDRETENEIWKTMKNETKTKKFME